MDVINQYRKKIEEKEEEILLFFLLINWNELQFNLKNKKYDLLNKMENQSI